MIRNMMRRMIIMGHGIWRDIGSNQINSMMRLRLGAPFGHIRKRSDHPKKYKLQTMLGEMLRNRRIASDDDIVKKVDESIICGFRSIGFSKGQVLREWARCVKIIREDYSDFYIKKFENERTKLYANRFNGCLEYSSFVGYHGVVKRYISKFKPAGINSLTLVPSQRLKNIIYTRKMYLHRQRSLVL